MGAITMFVGRAKQTKITRSLKAKQPEAIVFDATIEESFKGECDITQHPIEDGANISDHVILKPMTLALNGVITSTPLGLGASIQGVSATVTSKIGEGLGKALGGVVGSVAGGYAGKALSGVLGQKKDKELSAVVTQFIALRDSRQPLTIQTGLFLYENYMLQSFEIKRDQTTGQSLRVSLQLLQFTRADSTSVAVAIPKDASHLPKAKKDLLDKKAPSVEPSDTLARRWVLPTKRP